MARLQTIRWHRVGEEPGTTAKAAPFTFEADVAAWGLEADLATEAVACARYFDERREASAKRQADWYSAGSRWSRMVRGVPADDAREVAALAFDAVVAADLGPKAASYFEARADALEGDALSALPPYGEVAQETVTRRDLARLCAIVLLGPGNPDLQSVEVAKMRKVAAGAVAEAMRTDPNAEGTEDLQDLVQFMLAEEQAARGAGAAWTADMFHRIAMGMRSKDPQSIDVLSTKLRDNLVEKVGTLVSPTEWGGAVWAAIALVVVGAYTVHYVGGRIG